MNHKEITAEDTANEFANRIIFVPDHIREQAGMLPEETLVLIATMEARAKYLLSTCLNESMQFKYCGHYRDGEILNFELLFNEFNSFVSIMLNLDVSIGDQLDVLVTREMYKIIAYAMRKAAKSDKWKL